MQQLITILMMLVFQVTATNKQTKLYKVGRSYILRVGEITTIGLPGTSKDDTWISRTTQNRQSHVRRGYLESDEHHNGDGTIHMTRPVINEAQNLPELLPNRHIIVSKQSWDTIFRTVAGFSIVPHKIWERHLRDRWFLQRKQHIYTRLNRSIRVSQNREQENDKLH